MTGEALAAPAAALDQRPRWPPWFAPLGFLLGFALVLFLLGILTAVLAAAGVDVDDQPPGLIVAGTVIQDTVLVAIAVGLAATRLRPRLWHFGLRRTPFWPAVAYTVLAGVSFYLLVALYTALVGPEGDQSVVEDLGADQGTAALIAAAVVVVGFAPFAEELFFRAFFYGALRTKLGVWSAAGINGLVFGAIHYTDPDTLPLLLPLGLLGVILCLLYERTGSLYPPIALHAFNNAVAFAAQTGTEGAVVSSVVGLAALAVSVVAPARQRHDQPRPLCAGPPAGAVPSLPSHTRAT